MPLRLSHKLYEEIAAWAAEDLRSINGQIEYLLTLCVRQRKKTGRYAPDSLSEKETQEP
ncbi:MAG: PTS ascorbate transporter subunit IIC [Limnochordia bacterium]